MIRGDREYFGLWTKEKLVIDWGKQQQTRTAVQLAIEDILDAQLPESYSAEVSEQSLA